MTGFIDRLRWSTVALWHARRERTLPWWPEARIETVQNRRVRAIVRHAYATVPHYRDAMRDRGLVPDDITTAGDLRKLPLVHGRELAAEPQRFLSSRYANVDTLALTTTGTSGYYKEIRVDPGAVCAALAGGLRFRDAMAAIAAARARAELVLAPPGGTAEILRKFQQSHLLPALTGRVAVEFVSLDQPVEALVAAINARAPDVLASFGQLLGHVFREARARGLAIHRPRLVRYGGDAMRAEDRRVIEEHYGIPVISSYQSCEFLRIAHQCERRGGFHLYSDQVALRVIDERGNDVAPGATGEAVASNLVNRATVLLNFRLGDRIALDAARCACGRTLPLIAAIDGRNDDLLLRRSGERVHESTVLRRLYAAPGLVRAAITQHAIDRIDARIVVADTRHAEPTIADVRAALVELLDVEGPAIDVTVVDDLPAGPGGKFRAIVSHCASA